MFYKSIFGTKKYPTIINGICIFDVDVNRSIYDHIERRKLWFTNLDTNEWEKVVYLIFRNEANHRTDKTTNVKANELYYNDWTQSAVFIKSS